jgi:DNA-binding response OmpR family regulator/anti-anti-sigma regulatory factor
VDRPEDPRDDAAVLRALLERDEIEIDLIEVLSALPEKLAHEVRLVIDHVARGRFGRDASGLRHVCDPQPNASPPAEHPRGVPTPGDLNLGRDRSNAFYRRRPSVALDHTSQEPSLAMPRILTIDDSSTIRSIITKQMSELEFEVDQAEDGQQGLAKLEEISVDLILLDVTMPVMDGPTMLAALRERGDRTPVIMLTSESKRSIVAGAIKLGIEDYILKPFKPDELRGKVLKALKLDGSGGAGPVAANPAVASAFAPAAAPSAGASASRQFTDVLVVDDMENVHKKLRSLLPTHVSMNGCVSARDALQHCQERVYRVVVIDLVIPDVNSVALMNQLRALQPHAVMVALALRSAGDAGDVKGQGFNDVVYKPFEPAAVDDFLSKHFEVDDVLSVDGNVLQCAAFSGKEDKLDRYFSRLRTLCHESFEKLASACYDDTILDLSSVPLRNDKIVRLLMDSEKEAKKLGIGLRLVGTPEIKRVLSAVMETAAMPFYATRADAQSGA